MTEEVSIPEIPTAEKQKQIMQICGFCYKIPKLYIYNATTLKLEKTSLLGNIPGLKNAIKNFFSEKEPSYFKKVKLQFFPECLQNLEKQHLLDAEQFKYDKSSNTLEVNGFFLLFCYIRIINDDNKEDANTLIKELGINLSIKIVTLFLKQYPQNISFITEELKNTWFKRIQEIIKPFMEYFSKYESNPLNPLIEHKKLIEKIPNMEFNMENITVMEKIAETINQAENSIKVLRTLLTLDSRNLEDDSGEYKPSTFDYEYIITYLEERLGFLFSKPELLADTGIDIILLDSIKTLKEKLNTLILEESEQTPEQKKQLKTTMTELIKKVNAFVYCIHTKYQEEISKLTLQTTKKTKKSNPKNSSTNISTQVFSVPEVCPQILYDILQNYLGIILNIHELGKLETEEKVALYQILSNDKTTLYKKYIQLKLVTFRKKLVEILNQIQHEKIRTNISYPLPRDIIATIKNYIRIIIATHQKECPEIKLSENLEKLKQLIDSDDNDFCNQIFVISNDKSYNILEELTKLIDVIKKQRQKEQEKRKEKKQKIEEAKQKIEREEEKERKKREKAEQQRKKEEEATRLAQIQKQEEEKRQKEIEEENEKKKEKIEEIKKFFDTDSDFMTLLAECQTRKTSQQFEQVEKWFQKNIKDKNVEIVISQIKLETLTSMLQTLQRLNEDLKIQKQQKERKEARIKEEEEKKRQEERERKEREEQEKKEREKKLQEEAEQQRKKREKEEREKQEEARRKAEEERKRQEERERKERERKEREEQEKKEREEQEKKEREKKLQEAEARRKEEERKRKKEEETTRLAEIQKEKMRQQAAEEERKKQEEAAKQNTIPQEITPTRTTIFKMPEKCTKETQEIVKNIELKKALQTVSFFKFNLYKITQQVEVISTYTQTITYPKPKPYYLQFLYQLKYVITKENELFSELARTSLFSIYLQNEIHNRIICLIPEQEKKHLPELFEFRIKRIIRFFANNSLHLFADNPNKQIRPDLYQFLSNNLTKISREIVKPYQKLQPKYNFIFSILNLCLITKEQLVNRLLLSTLLEIYNQSPEKTKQILARLPSPQEDKLEILYKILLTETPFNKNIPALLLDIPSVRSYCITKILNNCLIAFKEFGSEAIKPLLNVLLEIYEQSPEKTKEILANINSDTLNEFYEILDNDENNLLPENIYDAKKYLKLYFNLADIIKPLPQSFLEPKPQTPESRQQYQPRKRYYSRSAQVAQTITQEEGKATSAAKTPSRHKKQILQKDQPHITLQTPTKSQQKPDVYDRREFPPLQ